jgi:hypothetical protein
MKTQYFDAFKDALKEAERLKQINFYRFEAHNYMVTQAENVYAVDRFTWPARDAALKSNSLLFVI